MAQIVRPDDHILAEVRNNAAHLLKARDRGNVEKVLRLLREYEIAPYIGRGVMKDHIFNGNKGYGDVDIIGAVQNIDSSQYNSFLQLLDGKGRVDIDGRLFIVYDVGPTSLTGGGGAVDRRFILNPMSKYAGMFRGSNIDLGIVSNDRLERVVMPKFLSEEDRR
ncbi:hypothetical protein HY212_02975 [Candidatus Pacearchaeota archaeon]|nr:hypothetical protein [Candidatus Pacearchaeota archaeon]